MGCKGYKHTKKIKEKMRISKLGNKNPMFNKISPMRKFYKNKEWLYQKYVNEKLSMNDIGHILNINKTVIYDWLNRLKIPTRNLYDDHPNKHRCGKENHNWNGGKTVNCGYLSVRVDFDHPAKDRNMYVRKHRLVVEDKIKRFLKKEEQIHHIDNDKMNNKIENLMLFPNAKKHTEFHKFLDRLAVYLLGLTKVKPTFDFKYIKIFDKQIKKIFFAYKT